MTNAETQEKDTAKALNDEVDQAADRAADLRAAFEERASAAREWAADQTVQTKPFIAIGVSAASAFAAGLVLGVLLTRR
jgi:ElaB/YqjD/DUF883 family membrane-anchored ribosome-binding protein